MSYPVPPLDQKVLDLVESLKADEKIQKAMALAEAEVDRAMQEQIELCEIPAPTFSEMKRAEDVARRMREYGLKDVTIDGIGNVIGKRPGKKGGKVVAMAAHMDSVFTNITEIKVKQEGNIYRAPGIGDNVSGLRALLQILRCYEAAGIETEDDLWFVGTVGEEGNGDIRGSKYLVEHNKLDAMIAIDSTDVGRVLRGAVGSHRWRVAIDGTGGHSFASFGEVPSAVHAMCRAGAKIADIRLSAEPKTTYTIGTIKGGTSVNTIAAHCEVDVDMRSVNNDSLLALEAEILAAFDAAVEEENAYWGVTDEALKLRVTKTQIGNRPAGIRPDSCPVLQAARCTQKVLGIEKTSYTLSSTDANAPMSRNIPSTCLCSGGRGVGAHTVDEYFEMKDTHMGPQLILLTSAALAGACGREPLI